jgi:hypothetical protein
MITAPIHKVMARARTGSDLYMEAEEWLHHPEVVLHHPSEAGIRSRTLVLQEELKLPRRAMTMERNMDSIMDVQGNHHPDSRSASLQCAF